MSGKGSSPRPFSIGQEEFQKNWDRIFKNEDSKLEVTPEEEEAWKDLEKRNKGGIAQLGEQ